MATGDQDDMLSRLKALLPTTWFSSANPVLDGLLSAAAYTLSWFYSLYLYAALQTRIKTATDGWLDMIANDFFGPTFYRRSGQSDASFRAWIIVNMFRERGTRNSVIKILTDLTGRAPLIIEFNKPTDTGAYRGPHIGYGLAGAYGSLTAMDMQTMVTAYRPQSVAGSPLGYIPTDAELIAAVESVRPATYVIWVKVSD